MRPELGLLENNGSPSVLLQHTATENINELRQLSADCLSRAGLSELSEKLAGLAVGKRQ